MLSLMQRLTWAAFVAAAFTTSPHMAAQTTPSWANPNVTVEIGEDAARTGSIHWYDPDQYTLPSTTGSFGLRFTATRANAERTWVIVLGRIYLDPINPASVDPVKYNYLISHYPFLTPPTSIPTFGSLRHSDGNPLNTVSANYLDSDLIANDNVPFVLDPATAAGVLGTSVVDNNGVKQWGQPFVNDPAHATDPSLNFAWRTMCTHWADTSICPSGYSNFFWSGTYSRTPGTNSIYVGDQLMNINRLSEALVTIAMNNVTASQAFLRSMDYRTALTMGLKIGLQVISIRGPGQPSAWASTSIATGGVIATAPNDLAGLKIRAPIYLRPLIGQIDVTGMAAYESAPSSITPVVPGNYMFIALGESASYSYARFKLSGDSTTVDSPIYPWLTGTGLALVWVPSNAIPGTISWIQSPTPGYGAKLTNSSWDATGQMMLDYDAAPTEGF